jgi:hypothetical protein
MMTTSFNRDGLSADGFAGFATFAELLDSGLADVPATGGGVYDVLREADEPPVFRGDPILIRTRVSIATGVVLSGSSIGDSPFCPAHVSATRTGRHLVDAQNLSLPRRHPEDRVHHGPQAKSEADWHMEDP